MALAKNVRKFNILKSKIIIIIIIIIITIITIIRISINLVYESNMK